MKIAAAYENGQICQDFGQAPQFKLYTIEEDRIVQMELVDAQEPRTAFLKEQGTGLLVCGKLDMAAQMELLQAGIAPFPGAYGDADMQVGALFVRMLESEKQTKAAEKAEAGCAETQESSCETCAHKDTCADYAAKK